VGRHRTPLEKGQRTDCRYCGQKFKVGESRHTNACPARPNRPHEPNTVLKVGNISVAPSRLDLLYGLTQDNDLTYKLRLARDTAQALGDQVRHLAIMLGSYWLIDVPGAADCDRH
jgi:hypothetical protein